MKYLSLGYVLPLILILAVGCASKEKKRNAKSQNDVATMVSPATADEKAKAFRVDYNQNELIMKVSEFIAQHPASSLEDVVNYANKLLQDIGLPFSLISPAAEIAGAETYVKTESGVVLNVGLGSEPLCSTGIVVTYPVLSRAKGLWNVKYKSGEYQIRGAPLRVGEIHRIKDNRLERKVGLPEEGPEPGGISAGGESVFTRFDLTPAASSWWQRVMRRDAHEEAPFLVLEVGENDFEFTDDEDFYDNFDYSPKKEDLENDMYRLKFENSKFYYQGMSCG